MLLAVSVGVSDNSLDNIGSLSNLAGDLLSNALLSCLSGLAGLLGGLDDDLLRLGDTVDANELGLEDCGR